MGTESPFLKSSIFCPSDQVPKLSVIPEESRIHSRLQTVYAAPTPTSNHQGRDSFLPGLSDIFKPGFSAVPS